MEPSFWVIVGQKLDSGSKVRRGRKGFLFFILGRSLGVLTVSVFQKVNWVSTGWILKGAQHPAVIFKQNDSITYMIGQEEESKTEKRHYQIYFQFDKKKRGKQLTMFPSGQWHSKAAKGTSQQNKTYCHKSKTAIEDTQFEFGTMKVIGRTTKLSLLVDEMDNGLNYKQLWEFDKETMIRHHKGVKEGLSVMGRVETKVEYELKDFTEEPIDEGWRKKCAIILHGTPGSGKTSYALAHFAKPLLVRDINDLRALSEDTYDGIVFDDIHFLGEGHFQTGMKSVGFCIALTDIEHASSIRILYGTASIPAGMQMIFTTNEKNGIIFPSQGDSQFGIERRVHTIEIKNKLF